MAHDRVVSLIDELESFAIHVSLIGQVKAGKTALTNALIGKPNMLPSDVNPWTSVVTSVHINTTKPAGANAVFNFFTTQEWLSMVEAGGTLGEAANRAGFAAEANQMRNQIREMQQRTEQRLGRNFNLLMGGQHTFMGFSPTMLQKYVCLGDETDASAPEGRYADVTKTADLYIDSDRYRVPTIIQDTPGVNDPFLMRETVTLNSLGNTDICVLVLSAQQSFSTVDVGLLRVVRSLKKQQIIFFVNRIDELSNPNEQIPEIDAYIRGILADQELPTDVPIIFGSAVWGEIASFGMNATGNPVSMDKLDALAAARKQYANDKSTEPHPIGSIAYTLAKAQDLSGLFDLRNLIAAKSRMDNGFPKLANITQRAREIVSSSLAFLDQSDVTELRRADEVGITGAIARVEAVHEKVQQSCQTELKAATRVLLSSISDTYSNFLDHEEEALTAETGAPLTDWKPNIEVLRRRLMASYAKFSETLPIKIGEILIGAAQEVQGAYDEVLNNPVKIFHVEPLQSNCPPKPLCLMKTLPLDISSSWLSNWMPKKVKLTSLLRKLNKLVEAEAMLVLAEIQSDCIDDFAAENTMIVDGFFEDHIRGLKNLVLLRDKGQHEHALDALGMENGIKVRLETLSEISDGLNALATRIDADLHETAEAT
ncbi:dynamin family protein [Loktanella sp. D2R18]|uniref:dynamin family protein n=1 Tax=Loktanella sp. D2R18 TaxID=2267230 RepID=UPI0015F0DFDD|nr:dynamin family protein [Loktanella sp. D2R18]MDO6590358.1 dynamin family protein [Yoonia sp. 1_MG-2023]